MLPQQVWDQMVEMLTLDNVIRALGGRTRTSTGLADQVSDVVIDSRLARAGSLFVAMRGEQVDGHLYTADALTSGAIAAIVERETGCETVLELGDPGHAPDELDTLPVCLRVTAWRRCSSLRRGGEPSSTCA